MPDLWFFVACGVVAQVLLFAALDWADGWSVTRRRAADVRRLAAWTRAKLRRAVEPDVEPDAEPDAAEALPVRVKGATLDDTAGPAGPVADEPPIADIELVLARLTEGFTPAAADPDPDADGVEDEADPAPTERFGRVEALRALHGDGSTTYFTPVAPPPVAQLGAGPVYTPAALSWHITVDSASAPTPIAAELDDPCVGRRGTTLWFDPRGDGLHDPALDHLADPALDGTAAVS